MFNLGHLWFIDAQYGQLIIPTWVASVEPMQPLKPAAANISSKIDTSVVVAGIVTCFSCKTVLPYSKIYEKNINWYFKQDNVHFLIHAFTYNGCKHLKWLESAYKALTNCFQNKSWTEIWLWNNFELHALAVDQNDYNLESHLCAPAIDHMLQQSTLDDETMLNI